MSADLGPILTMPAAVVAPQLLGSVLTHVADEGTVSVQLSEVEAYDGEGDPASHTFRGMTRRNAVMFGPAGHLYVYFSYGMHWCANVVCGPEGRAAAVLLRSGRVVEGTDLARCRRGELVPERALARGPANLTKCLGIDASCNGADLIRGDRLALTPGEPVHAVSCGPRVGVSAAADVRWRFWAADDETVSAYRRSPRAEPGKPGPSRQGRGT